MIVVIEIGAGDAFMAGLLDGLVKSGVLADGGNRLSELSSADWVRLGRRANAVGALVTTKPGTAEGMPTASELEQFSAGHD